MEPAYIGADQWNPKQLKVEHSDYAVLQIIESCVIITCKRENSDGNGLKLQRVAASPYQSSVQYGIRILGTWIDL